MRYFLFAALVLASCSRSPTPSIRITVLDAAPPGLRYGAVMIEVGRRFELAGRAVQSGRFELAEFEVGELEEAFADDLPHAEPPKEGISANLGAQSDAFLKSHLPALKAAAHAKDRTAFASAFQRAAVACNTCHQGSGHGFVEIPTAIGAPVPMFDPVDGGGR